MPMLNLDVPIVGAIHLCMMSLCCFLCNITRFSRIGPGKKTASNRESPSAVFDSNISNGVCPFKQDEQRQVVRERDRGSVCCAMSRKDNAASFFWRPSEIALLKARCFKSRWYAFLFAFPAASPRSRSSKNPPLSITAVLSPKSVRAGRAS